MVDYEMFNKIDSEKLSTAVYTVNELTMTSICQWLSSSYVQYEFLINAFVFDNTNNIIRGKLNEIMNSIF